MALRKTNVRACHTLTTLAGLHILCEEFAWIPCDCINFLWCPMQKVQCMNIRLTGFIGDSKLFTLFLTKNNLPVINQMTWFYCCLRYIRILFWIYNLGMCQLCSWCGKSIEIQFFLTKLNNNIFKSLFKISFSFSFCLCFSVFFSVSFQLVGNSLQNMHQMCSLKALLFAACDYDTPLPSNQGVYRDTLFVCFFCKFVCFNNTHTALST